MEVALSANATAVGGPPGGKLILKNLKEGEKEREKKKKNLRTEKLHALFLKTLQRCQIHT